jgi:isopentenyl phosphate kinase
MARPIVLLKLGGSLITDKRRPGVARPAAIRRLAREIAAASRGRGARLLVGHGSGSFGHDAAARGGLTPGTDARRRLDAVAATQRRAGELHRLVIEALADAGARPFSFAPSSFLEASDGRVARAFLEPIFTAVDGGFLPVVYGDIIVDRSRGALVVSTEALFLILARAAARRRLPIARAIWLGETDGVCNGDGGRITRLQAFEAVAASRRVSGASGVDVTGGMALRLRTAGALARTGVPSAIVDGRRRGVVAWSISRRPGGTWVAAR